MIDSYHVIFLVVDRSSKEVNSLVKEIYVSERLVVDYCFDNCAK